MNNADTPTAVNGYTPEELLAIFNAVRVGIPTLGFDLDGVVYAAIGAEVRPCYVKVDVHGKETLLRMNLKDNHKRDLRRHGAYALGDYDILTAEMKARYTEVTGKPFPTTRNQGWMFEYALRKYFGLTWAPDSVPLWVDADVQVGSSKLCLKYSNARVLTSSNLRELERAGKIASAEKQG